jgi:hypothetical protein
MVLRSLKIKSHMVKFTKVLVEHWKVIALLTLLSLFLWSVPFWIEQRKFYSYLKDEKGLSRTLFVEIFKLFFIVLIGGIAVGEYNRGRQKRVDRNNFRNEMYKMLVDTYIDLKRIRWSLRTNCRNEVLPTTVYRSAVNKLIDVKSKLEFIDSQIRTDKKSFTEIREPLLANLENMEDYLRHILKEFAKGPSEVEEEKTTNVSNHECLGRFIKAGSKNNGIKEDSDFTKSYRVHFQSAISKLKGVEANL